MLHPHFQAMEVVFGASMLVPKTVDFIYNFILTILDAIDVGYQPVKIIISMLPQNIHAHKDFAHMGCNGVKGGWSNHMAWGMG